MPREVFESELFGHEKGAFTGAVSAKPGLVELADGGTLLLDEIGELAPDSQVKLLRALEAGTFFRVGATRPRRVDVRLVAATNRDLAEAMRSGEFRQDLYYRINTITIKLPPLRERREDIALLANHFVAAYATYGARQLGSRAAAARVEIAVELRDGGRHDSLREGDQPAGRADGIRSRPAARARRLARRPPIPPPRQGSCGAP